MCADKATTHDGGESPELETLKAEREEYLDGWKRAKADFANYKKDEERRRIEMVQFANADLILDILLVLDSFDLALEGGDEKTEADAKGLYVIKSQLENILKRRGVEEIKALGQPFNPEFHEAIAAVEAPEKPDSTVLEVMGRGYTLHGRVLRPARVKVSHISKKIN